MRYLIILLVLISNLAQADKIKNYIEISSSIPQMELKADPHSQSWARSARNIITSTDETILQTAVLMNSLSAKQGKPLFCFSNNTKIDNKTIDTIIKNTYRDLVAQGKANVNNMSVSEVAVIGIANKYPCTAAQNNDNKQAQQKTITPMQKLVMSGEG